MNRFLFQYCRFLLPIVTLLCSSIPVRAWYIGEEEFAAATLINGELSHYNYVAGCSDVNLIATNIQPGSGQRPAITLEITNNNYREEKSYPVYLRESSGKKITHKVKHPEWGVLWGYHNTQNYHALLFRTGESDPQGYNPPTLQYCIFTVAQGDTTLHTPWSNAPESYLNPEGDYNHLLILPANGGFEIFIGKEREYRLALCPDDRLFGDQAGIYIGSGANVSMRNWSVTSQKYTERTPYWTEGEIYTHLVNSKNPYEGIYEIASATSTSSNIRLGGNYRLALINTDNEYKLLYLEGAQRAADQWKLGMVKAIFRPITDEEFMQVTWYDSNHTPLTNEIKAGYHQETFKIIFSLSGTILSLVKITQNTQEQEQQKKNEGPFRLL